MPIYEYRCRHGHEFEVFQAMTDAPVSGCEVCEQPVERVFRPVAVHFKGSGFYTTDYARKRPGSSDGAPSAKESSATSEGKGGSDESKKPDGEAKSSADAKSSSDKPKSKSATD